MGNGVPNNLGGWHPSNLYTRQLSTNILIIIEVTNTKLNTIRKLIPKVLTLYLQDPNIVKLSEELLDKFVTNVKNRGLAQTLIQFKEIRLCVTRYLSGDPILHSSNVSLNKYGLPKILKDWVPYMDNHLYLKALMTILVVGRAFKTKPVLDIEPIITKWNGAMPFISTNDYEQILSNLNLTKFDPEYKEPHFSTKSGPNGPAMITCLTDLAGLSQNQIDNIGRLGDDLLRAGMRKPFMQTPLGYSALEIESMLEPNDNIQTRKLSVFSDKEGKTRVIAIFDYWSQCALRPVHNKLMQLLKGIKTDCTFNQIIDKSLLGPGPYYSFDLSSATDRMPVVLQHRILSSLIGRMKADAWRSILIDDGFYNRRLSEKIYYKAGQPMGAYSSWPAMAITHHFIVQWAAKRAGIPGFFTSYCLLGDDIVIADRLVADQYKILCSLLDMPISFAKTHVSNHLYEFAKRWVYKGNEITGFSIGGLLSVKCSYALLHEYISNQSIRGWELPIQRHPELIKIMTYQFGKFSQTKRIVKLYLLYHYLISFIQAVKSFKRNETRLPGVVLQCMNLVNHIHEHWRVPLPFIKEYDNAQILNLMVDQVSEVKVRIVEKDMERLFDNRQALEDIALRKFKEFFPDLSAPHYSALRRATWPVYTVLSDVMRKGAELMNQLAANSEELDLFELGISKYFISDKIFSMRKSQSISLAQAQMAKQFLFVWKNNINRQLPLIEHLNKMFNGWDPDPYYYNLKDEEKVVVP